MPKSHHDYSTLLIYGAVLVSISRFVGAFLASDLGKLTGIISDVVTGLIAISGIGLGLIDVFGAAYLLDGWRLRMPKSGQAWSFRFKILTVFVFLLLLTGVVILVPFTVSRVSHRSMQEVLGTVGLWIWSLSVNAAPYLIIGGVITAQSGVVTVSLPQDMQVSETVPTRHRKKYPAKTDWRYLSDTDRKLAGTLSVKELEKRFRVSERTARNWKARTNENKT